MLADDDPLRTDRTEGAADRILQTQRQYVLVVSGIIPCHSLIRTIELDYDDTPGRLFAFEEFWVSSADKKTTAKRFNRSENFFSVFVKYWAGAGHRKFGDNVSLWHGLSLSARYFS
jgi:hypothetical protein